MNTGSTPVDPTEPSQPDQPGETAKLPTADPTVTKKTDYTSYNDYYELKFSDDDKAWVNNITGITFGNDEYEAVDSISDLSSKKYHLDHGKWSDADIMPFSFYIISMRSKNIIKWI